MSLASATLHDAAVWKDYVVPFASAVLGALVAYFPSRLLARRASREVLARDAQDRRELELGLARRAFVKLGILVNSACGFHQHVEQMIAKADRDGNTQMPLWSRISTFPAVDREPTIMFEADELAVFIAAKNVAYVDQLVLLARRHAANLASLAAFGKMKAELHYNHAQLGETHRDANNVSTTFARVGAGTANYLRLKAEELELFTRELRTLLADSATMAEQTAEQFGPITRLYFHDGSLPAFEKADRTSSAAN